jgi:cytochrome c-type biogenesis protein CcmH
MKAALFVATFLFAASAWALDPATLDDPDQDARYRALIEEIRCLVCQNQTLADSNAPLAVDLREQVRAMVEQGASDDEIIAYLTARYGDFVLYRPPFNAVTALLWLSPLLFLLIGGFVGWRVMRSRSSQPELDDAGRARIRALLDGDAER